MQKRETPPGQRGLDWVWPILLILCFFINNSLVLFFFSALLFYTPRGDDHGASSPRAIARSRGANMRMRIPFTALPGVKGRPREGGQAQEREREREVVACSHYGARSFVPLIRSFGLLAPCHFRAPFPGLRGARRKGKKETQRRLSKSRKKRAECVID